MTCYFFRVRNHYLFLFFFWLEELNEIFIRVVTVLGVTRKNVTPWTIFGMPWTKGSKMVIFFVLFELNNQVETRNLFMNCLFIINKETKSMYGI